MYDKFSVFKARVHAKIDAVLREVESRPHASETGISDVLAQIRAISMRGGKRLRSLLVLAGAEAVAPHEEYLPSIVDVAAAVELLQTYLLIHDDWMDDDVIRRGGPTAHIALAKTTGYRWRGDVLAVLAGDLACAMAHGILGSLNILSAYRSGVIEMFTEMQYDAAFGQVMDVLGRDDVEVVGALKTGGYTTIGPLVLGARLVCGYDETEDALRNFGKPLGVAFQLRDDLLGVFGDEAETGKPSGHDLRAGRAVAPVIYAERRLRGEDLNLLSSALVRAASADPGVSNGGVAEARDVIRESGAVEEIEARIASLRDTAIGCLHEGSVRATARDMLTEFAGNLTDRAR